MQSLNVVIAHGDCVVAESLASHMHGYFRNVAVAPTTDEIRATIKRHQADAVVVDLDMVSFQDVRHLCHDFSNVSIVTTHRIPDEAMWSNSLDAGAVDCCDQQDVKTIISSIERNASQTQRFRVARAA